MPGYLSSTHFTGGHVIRVARLTKIKIHLNVEGKSISCLAGSGNWCLNSSSYISDALTALGLRNRCLPVWRKDRHFAPPVSSWIIRAKAAQKLLLKCVSAWGIQSCLCEAFYVVCIEVNWFKHHPYLGQSRATGGGVPAASTKQSKWTFCTISGQNCWLPPLGMGAGRAKTRCRTQNILNYLVQHFIVVEICIQQKRKT